MRTEQIVAFQEALKRCQIVWAVYVTCDGETDVHSLWDTKAAADLACAHHNGMKGNGAGYYGRAKVASHRLQNEAMAREMFGTAART